MKENVTKWTVFLGACWTAGAVSMLLAKSGAPLVLMALIGACIVINGAWAANEKKEPTTICRSLLGVLYTSIAVYRVLVMLSFGALAGVMAVLAMGLSAAVAIWLVEPKGNQLTN